MSDPHPDDAPLIAARKWAKSDPEQSTRRHNHCMAPIELTPAAIEAFTRRQEILIADEKWPVQHWYSDEDFCRAYNMAVELQQRLAAANQRCERLEALYRLRMLMEWGSDPAVLAGTEKEIAEAKKPASPAHSA